MENKKRLIDANVLKTLFDVRYDTAFIQERTRENKDQWHGYCTGINWGRNTIANAPTVDAAPVVHGRWLYYSTTMQECSNCQRHTARHKFKYCPHCGAVMEDKYNDG